MKTKYDQQQRIRLLKALLALGALMLCGCAGSSPVTLGAVGPANGLGRGPDGRLIVYSATEAVNDGDLMYYPHSGYQIYNKVGSRFKYVANHISRDDEEPNVVTLPAGQYTVVADSELDGRVNVPVLIVNNRTTIVNLVRGRRGEAPVIPGSNAIVTPAGLVAGWRASP